MKLSELTNKIILGIIWYILIMTNVFAQEVLPEEQQMYAASEMTAELASLPAHDMYKFISFQEYDGYRNLTPVYWNKKEVTKLYANKDSMIRIQFDTDSFEAADNESGKSSFFTTGQISLSATIDNRNIEVEGYSEVGKDRTTVGTKVMPPTKFLSNMQQSQKILINLTEGSIYSSEERWEAISTLNSLLKEFLTDTRTAEAFYNVMKISPTFADIKLKRLNSIVSSIDQKIIDENKSKLSKLSRDYEKSNEEAYDTAMKINDINRRITGLENKAEKDRLVSEKNKLAEDLKNKMEIASEKRKKYQDYAETYSISGILSEQESEVSSLINDLNEIINGDYNLWFNEDPKKTTKGQMTTIKSYWELKENYKVQPTRRIRVYREIYKNLVDAQIDLHKADAKAGDIVNIDLLFTQQGTDKPVSFSIAKIYVEDFGDKVSVVDSFLLVKSTSGKFQDSSNFKGAAGVSLMYSYNPRPSEKGESCWKIFSGGINVSYLDFDPTKDIEVGVGPIIGLFGSKVQTGIGWNLNVDGNTNDRFYWYLGFSFTNIAGKFNEK